MSVYDITKRITEKINNDAMFITNFEMFVINHSRDYHYTILIKTGLCAAWACNYVSVSFTIQDIFLKLTIGRNGEKNSLAIQWFKTK